MSLKEEIITYISQEKGTLHVPRPQGRSTVFSQEVEGIGVKHDPESFLCFL